MKRVAYIFSAPMVRMILNGRKCVTRRLIKRPLSCAPGDIMIGRETWRCGDTPGTVEFRADYGDAQDVKWRSPIHMPWDFARIQREIEHVSCSRLHEIWDRDILDEGFPCDVHGFDCPGCELLRVGFRDAWDGINGHRPGAQWSQNPLVVRIQFARIKQL